MSPLEQFNKSATRAWDYLLEGWHHLWQRASQALTRFTPTSRRGELQTSADRIMEKSSRWGLLAAEVEENDDNIAVRLEVPGMQASDFDIEVIDRTLIVRGEKRVEREQSEGHYYLMERAYGRFERALPLPAEVNEKEAQAKYQRGVLWISLPKIQQAKHRIKIEAG